MNGIVRGTDLPQTEQSLHFKVEFERFIDPVLERIAMLEDKVKDDYSEFGDIINNLTGDQEHKYKDLHNRIVALEKAVATRCDNSKITLVDVDLPLESESILSTDFITSD